MADPRRAPRAIVVAALCGVPCWTASCSTSGSPAPEPASPRTLPEVGSDGTPLEARCRQLFTLALEQRQAYRILERLCATAPHRLSGTPGAARAVAWGQAEMLRLGLRNVRLEECMVPRWIRGPVAELTTDTGESFAITALGGSIGTPEQGIAGEVLMVRSFEQLRELGERARGRIVFFNRPMNPKLLNTFSAYGGAVDQRTSGPVETAKAGGVATLVRSMTTAIDDAPHTGATSYAEGVAQVPAAAISTRGAERLAALLGNGPVRLRLKLSCRSEPDVPSANVVGDLPGSERPEEIVLIGGHLDAWDLGQGAHDDGAGIAHCLAAIDLLNRAGIRPRRTIRVVLYMNEENGVRGARAYVEQHAGELHRHVAAIESDRGGLEPRGFTTSARDDRLAQVATLLQPLRAYGAGALIPGGGGVDVGLLGPTGTELFGLLPSSQRYFDYHHSERDRIENVNSRELALGSAAVAYLASVLADEPR